MTDFLDRIDSEVRAVLPSLPELDISDIPSARIRRRELAAQARSRIAPDPSVVTVDRFVDATLRVRHYRPVDQARPLPGLLWLHGGGHVLGEVEQDDPLLEHVVSTVGCAAVSVDWRRAPEHPFPAAIEDGYAALQWTVANAEIIGVDPSRVAIGGASSGGGLAAGLGLLTRDRGEVAVSFQLLIYPMLDDRNETPSSHLVHLPQLWNRTSNLLAWRAYLDGHPAEVSAYAAPARARNLIGVPATFIATGSLDGFVDEDIDYAQRLGQAGVSVELHVYPGAIHGFDLFAPASAVARHLVRDRDAALRRALFPSAPDERS